MWLIEHFKRRVLYDKRGILQFLPAAITAGSAIYSAIKGNKNKRGDSRLEGYEVPEFKEDPDFREMQDFLTELGPDILRGDIPDYFAGIGETGGAEFENYLNLMQGDIEESGLNIAAATGRGGGAVQDIIGQATGEFTTKSRYADFVRSLEGKQRLLDTGLEVTTGARSAGQAQQAQENTFALRRSGIETGLGKYLDEYDIDQNEYNIASDEAFYGDIGDMFGTAYGAFKGGKSTGTIEGALDTIFGGDSAAAKKSTVIDPAKKLSLGKIGGTALNIKEILAMLG